MKQAESSPNNVLLRLSVKLRAKSKFFGAPIGNESSTEEGTVTTSSDSTTGDSSQTKPLQLILQKRYIDPFTYTRVQELLYDLNTVVGDKGSGYVM